MNPESYHYEATRVDTRRFLPSMEVDDPDFETRAVVFVQGWGPQIEAESNDRLCERLADASETQVILANTHSKRSCPEQYIDEAAELVASLKEHGLSNVIFAGYSEGGQIAASAAAEAELDEEMKVSGVILIAPTGLTEQDPTSLAIRFALDTTVLTVPRMWLPHQIGGTGIARSPDEGGRLAKTLRAMKSGVDLIQGITREIQVDKLDYPRRLADDLTAMSSKSEDYAHIEAPILTITGKHDLIAGPDKISDSGVQMKTIVAERAGGHPLPLIRDTQIGKVMGQWSRRQFSVL